MKKKSMEKINLGQVLALEKNTRIRKANAADYKDTPVGVALHDIEVGEIVEYEQNKNTKDIVAFFSVFQIKEIELASNVYETKK